MKYLRTLILAFIAAAVLTAGSPAFAQGATVITEDAIWANGRLYGTVVTPTSFKSPPPRSTDVIYSFMMNELEGQRSVSEAAPGDRDYNGGRWSVHLALYTAAGDAFFDQDGNGIVDFELKSEEQVHEAAARGYLEIVDADFYFVCPLLP